MRERVGKIYVVVRKYPDISLSVCADVFYPQSVLLVQVIVLQLTQEIGQHLNFPCIIIFHREVFHHGDDVWSQFIKVESAGFEHNAADVPTSHRSY